MKTSYQTLSASSMSVHPNLAHIQDYISILDNLESQINLPQEEKDKLINRPIKSVSTITVLICLGGKVEIQVGLQQIQMEKDNCLFLKSGVVAEMKDMSDECRFFSLILNEDFFFPLINETTLALLQKAWHRNPICMLGEHDVQECTALYRRIKHRLLFPGKELFRNEILKGYVQSLLFILFARYFTQEEDNRQQNSGKITRKQDLYNRFIELVERNYTRERSITWYASELCITPRYLSQVVYQESGHYASEHIDNFVISEAKQLVRSRQYSIQQICDILNFSSQSFFGRYFKKFTGYSPSQYKNL